jgi:hypothetical protein
MDPNLEDDVPLSDDEDGGDAVASEQGEGEPAEGAVEEGAAPAQDRPAEPQGQPEGRQKQTAQDRIRQEIARRKEIEAELQRYRNHVLEMQRQAPPAPRPPMEDPNVLRERLEQMGDVERILWLQQQNALRDHQFNLQLQIQNDRIAFDRYVSANPQYERYSEQVEEAFHRGLQQGRPQSREEILDKMIGKEAREKTAATLAKAQRAGQQRIQQQTTRPASVRSNVPAGSTKTALSAEEILRRRLEGGEYGF